MPSEWSQQNARGVLYLVAVPIGHIDDITLRAIHILREADVIASENPAATRLLLSHHAIDATVTSYGPTHINEKVSVLIDRLQQGARIAFVSDCGSPVIADPGSCLVTAAHAHGIQVVSVPGPSALTTAIVAAGLDCDTVLFLGQLPETTSGIRRRLSVDPTGQTTTVAFCTPDTLALALHTVEERTPRRRVMLACDLSKPSERIVRGTAASMRRMLNDIQPDQDITLILIGRTPRSAKKKPGKKTQPAQSASSRRINTR
jgi:16S rRNA (cytidine1402-2'-O)-methyltransferase